MTLQLPAPSHTASRSVASAEHGTQLRPGIVRVGDAQRTYGYVEQVGRVYVSLAGSRYDRAVEVGQSLTLEHARQVLLPR